MLISDKEASKRLNSPMNLFNRMRTGSLRSHSESNSKSKAMDLFGIGKKNDPFKNAIAAPKEEVTVIVTPEVIEEKDNDVASQILDVDTKVKERLIHKTAVNILSKTMSELENKLPELAAPKLADVAVKMSKVIDTINNAKNRDRETERPVHLHFYSPEQRKLSDYSEVTV